MSVTGWRVILGLAVCAALADAQSFTAIAELQGTPRLLGFHDCGDLKDAEPDTLRPGSGTSPPRLAGHARQRVLKISADWPCKEAFLTCWQRLCAMPTLA